jgi:hypothetical protein
MKGGRIIWVYAVALAIGIFLQFDRVQPWLSAKFADGMPGWLAAVVDQGKALHQGLGLTALGLDLDCSTAGLFDGTYKNTYRCQDAALAEAGRPRIPGLGADYALAAPREVAAGENSGDDPKTTAVHKDKLSAPCNVLVVGDSLAVSLAVSLEKAFREYDGLTMIPKGKIASGLENPQYYNWEQALAQFVQEYDPQLVVVMMGANDAKYLNLDPESPEPVALSDRRRSAYENRLEKFLSVMDERGIKSYWIGLPVMGDPELARKSQALNAIIRQACQASAHGRFLDTWNLLASPEGAYSQHIADASGHWVRVREGDKIHFSTAGGDIIVKAILKNIEENIELPPKAVKQMAEAPTLPEVQKR